MSATDPHVLWARLETEPGGHQRILSPAVGLWIDPPDAGALVGAGGAIGRLECLGRRFRMLAPEGAAGRVLGARRARTVLAVEYGELLLRLSPIDAAVPDISEVASPIAPGHGQLAHGTLAVVAPSDGVFHAAPSPGAEPYVQVGQRVHLGQPIGIVEVMKTFHQLTYAGAGFPEHAEVVEVRAASGGDVRAGDLLFVFR
jgi:biotin carboxyl carrier protein